MKVIMMAAITLCGKISPAPLGSSLDRERLVRLRCQTDASLIGANTLREGDPELKGGSDARFRTRHRAVISATGNLPVAGKKLFTSPPAPLVFTSDKEKGRLIELLGERATVVSLPGNGDGLCLHSLMDKLSGRGVNSLLVEGGGKLNFSCLRQRIVDELIVTVVPLLSGDRNAASLADGNHPLGDPFAGMELSDCCRQTNGELFLRYRLKK